MEITPEIVRELLSYDPDSGVLIWRERGRHWFKTARDRQAWNTLWAGKRAGYIANKPDGYQWVRISLFCKLYKAHRLAWMWMTDKPLPPQIDHKNRDATDNRWANLRASSAKKNSRNMSMSRRNTSGVTGVSWSKPCGRWKAMSRAGGKLTYLGLFDEIDEAAMAVMEFRADHGYDSGHGLYCSPCQKTKGPHESSFQQ